VSHGRGVRALRALLVSRGVLAACLLLAGRASAQAPLPSGSNEPALPEDASAKRDEPGGDVRAPELLTFVEAVYPAAALDAAVEGTVVLRLSIDADGAVTNAEVMSPAGYGFDEAALTAALDFRFTPARKGEIRVPSRIAYEYEFRLPKAAPADAQAEPLRKPERPRRAPLAAPEPAALDVTVRGPSEVDERRRSAEAVTVIETEQVKRQSADLGEVLARTQGVGVRRAGGLGSDTRFSLGGLTDDQVRFFIDGVPLELAGFSFGVANVPVNLIERVEIHSGVVPIRLGADALGGAVNLITAQDVQGTHLAGSYELGSFDTHRLTLEGRHLQRSSGLFTRATGFFDSARNDYPMNVEVPTTRGGCRRRASTASTTGIARRGATSRSASSTVRSRSGSCCAGS